MKKSLLALALTSLVLAACSKPENKTDAATAEQHSQAASEVKHDQRQAHDMTHTAENSLDWSGDYQGKLPCADCEGMYYLACKTYNNKKYFIFFSIIQATI